MAENAPFLPGLSPAGGKPMHVSFDGGRLTSDAGVLLLAEVERRLKLAERLARCLAGHAAALSRGAACPDRAHPRNHQLRSASRTLRPATPTDTPRQLP